MLQDKLCLLTLSLAPVRGGRGERSHTPPALSPPAAVPDADHTDDNDDYALVVGPNLAKSQFSFRRAPYRRRHHERANPHDRGCCGPGSGCLGGVFRHRHCYTSILCPGVASAAPGQTRGSKRLLPEDLRWDHATQKARVEHNASST